MVVDLDALHAPQFRRLCDLETALGKVPFVLPPPDLDAAWQACLREVEEAAAAADGADTYEKTIRDLQTEVAHLEDKIETAAAALT